MDSDEYGLPDYDDKKPSHRQDKPRRGWAIWPWLVLLGLLIIGVGAIGPLIIR